MFRAIQVGVIAVVATFFCCVFANLQYALELVHFTLK